jgi:hypothetical protein
VHRINRQPTTRRFIDRQQPDNQEHTERNVHPAGLQPADLVNLELRRVVSGAGGGRRASQPVSIMALDANVPQVLHRFQRSQIFQPLSDPILERMVPQAGKSRPAAHYWHRRLKTKCTAFARFAATNGNFPPRASFLALCPSADNRDAWLVPRMPAVPFRIKVNIQPPGPLRIAYGRYLLPVLRGLHMRILAVDPGEKRLG